MTGEAASLDATHDPDLRSWVEGAAGHPEFPVQNLPFGVFEPADGAPRGGVAIGGRILDLAAVAPLLTGEAARAAGVAGAPTLNALLARGAGPRRALRAQLVALLTDSAAADRVLPALHDAADCRMHLPARIGDYTDFYAGIHHARNAGALFRPNEPLLPNYRHVPIGYHGRASSVVVSGHKVIRPRGQRRAPSDPAPLFEPSRQLDYELELGIWIGPGNDLGAPIPVTEAAAHISGYCLLNDWSARDIQAWEYRPLGPFLGKSFATTISPWIVTPEALAPFREAPVARPDGDPAPLDYLTGVEDQRGGGLRLRLEVLLLTPSMRARGSAPHRLADGDARHLYWTPAQLVAHHTSNGCNLRPGDLLGTGTISTPDARGLGSLLEATGGGAAPIELPGGERRGFLEDGDEVILRARASRDGAVGIGFGECRGTVRS